MVIQPAGDRFSPEDEVLVLQQFPVDQFAAREGMPVRKSDANPSVPRYLHVTPRRRRSADDKGDVEPSLDDPRGEFVRRTVQEVNHDPRLRRAEISQKIAKIVREERGKDSDAKNASAPRPAAAALFIA